MKIAKWGSRVMVPLVVGSIGLGVMQGCDNAADPTNGVPATAGASTNATPSPAANALLDAKSMTLVASLSLPNGNTIEFYDAGDKALVTETGKAYVQPANSTIRTLLKANRLVDLFATLKPGVSAPAALSDLEKKLGGPAPGSAAVSRSATVQSNISQKKGPVSSASGQPAQSGSGIQPETAIGCNNGCCDQQWLQSTFAECNWGGSWSAMLYNYLWSEIDMSDGTLLDAMVCSANGTSDYNLDGTHFNVDEATYRTYHFDCGCCNPFCDSDYHGIVNSSTNQHLHTHCGMVYYDQF